MTDFAELGAVSRRQTEFKYEETERMQGKTVRVAFQAFQVDSEATWSAVDNLEMQLHCCKLKLSLIYWTKFILYYINGMKLWTNTEILNKLISKNRF